MILPQRPSYRAPPCCHGNRWSCTLRLDWLGKMPRPQEGGENLCEIGCHKLQNDILIVAVFFPYCSRNCTGCDLISVWRCNNQGRVCASQHKTWLCAVQSWMAQLSLYVCTCGLKPRSFHLISFYFMSFVRSWSDNAGVVKIFVIL